MSLVNTETGEVAEVPTIEDLEEIIGRGFETFIEVGDALAKVRDAKLYLRFAETFEAYCSERWGLSRSRAYQLIEAAEVSTMVDTAPTNERQARELLPLKDDPAAAERAMATATATAAEEDRKPTAADVKAAVEAERTPADEAWAEAEADDTDLQRQVRQTKAARVIERIAKARAELDHVHPDDFTNDQLRYLTGLGSDLPRLVGRIKSQRAPHLRTV